MAFPGKCLKSGSNLLFLRKTKCLPHTRVSTPLISKKFCSSNNNSELGSSTILIQDGMNVQELPVIVRKMNDISFICDNKIVAETENSVSESNNYHLIQAEFNHCTDLRDVFSLLSKCMKITPNIALGAMERIYILEQNGLNIGPSDSRDLNATLPKGAILDKLLNVILKTEDSQTLLNAFSAVSSFMEPYKFKFCDELLVRVTENKLTIEQLCDFVVCLSKSKTNSQFAETIDKLWVGFSGKQKDINEKNVVLLFNILPNLKSSKKTVANLLEKKLSTLWWKLKAQEMQDILNILSQEKYWPPRSLSIAGRWLNTNIHLLSEDSLLDIVTKFTKLKYHDSQIEKAIERYVKIKGIKIESQMLIVGILNHCMEFNVRNTHILSGCSEYFSVKGTSVPPVFLKSFIYPFGFLHFQPSNSLTFWTMVEKVLAEKFSKISPDDVLSIVLACIYLEKYPLNFVDKIFNPHFLAKVNNSNDPDKLRAKLQLIDTAMALECQTYNGPMLPKDHWAKSAFQDSRIKRIIHNTKESLETLAGGVDRLSTSVLVPHLFTNELYVIDAMIHPAGLGSSILNLKFKSDRNVNVAILVHLPEHYCSHSDQLVGPQLMRIKHLRLLGMKVAVLKYSTLNKLRIHTVELEKYLVNCLKNAENCL